MTLDESFEKKERWSGGFWSQKQVTRGTQNHEKQRFSPPKTCVFNTKTGFLMVLGAPGSYANFGYRVFSRLFYGVS